MSDKQNIQDTQGQTTNEQPLSWEAIAKLSKQEYEARREEIQRWMSTHVKAGKIVD